MKGFIRSKLALPLAVFIMSAAIVAIPFSRYITHAQAGTSIDLKFDSLPSAQGFTYFQSDGIPEDSVFSVNGTHTSLTQTTKGIGQHSPNYMMPDVVDGSTPFVLTVRVRILAYETFGVGGPGGFFFDVRTATPNQEYAIEFTPSLVTDPLGNSVAIDTTVFHTYTLKATPGGNYTLYIDGQFALGGPFSSSGGALNAVQLGDGNTQGANANAKITEFEFSQPPPLWGVDSKSPITKPVTGYGTLYDYVSATFGTPDFWGRYIGQGRSKDMDVTEASFAHAHGFAILPIYFNYNPLKVMGYPTGQAYATAAINDAQQRLGIPKGVAIFVDIETTCDPPSCPSKTPVVTDAAFIQGWYDTFNSNFGTYLAGTYKAGYYANTSTNSNFDAPFCAAVNNLEPAIGTNSFIWTNQKSQDMTNLTFGVFSKASSSAYNPLALSCVNQQIPRPAAWQYGLNNNSSSMVDVDEAQSSLPLW